MSFSASRSAVALSPKDFRVSRGLAPIRPFVVTTTLPVISIVQNLFDRSSWHKNSRFIAGSSLRYEAEAGGAEATSSLEPSDVAGAPANAQASVRGEGVDRGDELGMVPSVVVTGEHTVVAQPLGPRVEVGADARSVVTRV